MFKSQLQEYAQKAGLRPPVYEVIREGPSHEPRFKAIVTLQGVNYESPSGFSNLKKAEHAAAQAALEAIAKSSNESGLLPSPVHESGLCKNLLQEYAQKNSLPLPVYRSERSGEIHAPTFSSSVEIAGVFYLGGTAKTKKEAEIKAAKTALFAIYSETCSAVNLQPTATNTQFVFADRAPIKLVDSNLELLGGKKRRRGAGSAPGEPLGGKLKLDQQQTVKNEKAKLVDLLSAPIRQEQIEIPGKLKIEFTDNHNPTTVDDIRVVESTLSTDIKPALLAQTSSSVQHQDPSPDQGQKLLESQVKEQLQAFATQDPAPFGISVGSA